jgi:hypothetical protein
MTFKHAFQQTPILKQTTDLKGNRCYQSESGEFYESVTTFLGRTWNKGNLIAWQKRLGASEAEKERKRAAIRGKNLHTLAESYLMNEKVNYNNDPMNQVLFVRVLPLLNKIDNIRLIETPLYSDEIKLAGTPDIIADYENDLAVIDLKTSSKKKKREWVIHYFLQVACYGVMYNEIFGVLPKKAVLIIASEEVQSQIFTENMETCVKMLRNYLKDPIKFQVKAGNK